MATRIVGMKKLRDHLKELQKDVVVSSGSSSKATKGFESVLEMGATALRAEYVTANESGVENTDNVNIETVIEGSGGFIRASRDGLFFAEFGSGVNLNGGTAWGRELGYTPTSWSASENGKGFLTGSKYITFQGWWPVRENTMNAERREFTNTKGKSFKRWVVQGNAPVNGSEAAVRIMQALAAQKMKEYFQK